MDLAGGTALANEDALFAPLGRLFITSGPQKIFGASSSGGLFSSNSASNRKLLESLVERGFVALDDPETPTECWLTATGRQWLLEKQNPRLLLEDFVRAAEAQRDSVRMMASTLEELKRHLDRQYADLRSVLGLFGGIAAPTMTTAGHSLDVEEFLQQHSRSGSPADCSMAELFDRMLERKPEITIGEFHDAVRALQRSGRLALSPWTGPLYELPRPELAMLIGHEVLYYVRLCRSLAA